MVFESYRKYGGELVQEYARIYLEGRKGIYEYKDLKNIGLGQENEEKTLSENSSLLWCDTDLITILIWSLDKFGKIDPMLLKAWDKTSKRNRHYFLCYPDIPWEYDVLRENPHDRKRIFDLYANFLVKNKLSYSVLKGAKEEKHDIIAKSFNILK